MAQPRTVPVAYSVLEAVTKIETRPPLHSQAGATSERLYMGTLG